MVNDSRLCNVCRQDVIPVSSLARGYVHANCPKCGSYIMRLAMPLSCPGCDFTCADWKTLWQHIESTHLKESSCPTP